VIQTTTLHIKWNSTYYYARQNGTYTITKQNIQESLL